MSPSQKIFNIGANKTGTTTMQAIFKYLGLKVAPQREGELAGIDYEKGMFKALNFYIQKYDAFQDVPFSTKSTFAVVDTLFPGSKFILTYRDSEEWFKSFLNFHKKIMRIDPDLEKPRQEDFKKIIYLAPGYLEFRQEVNWLLKINDDLSVEKDWDLAYNKEHYISLYNQRNNSIVRHFSERPEDLLVIDITKEETNEKILEFLNLPQSLQTKIPHLNKT